MSEGEKKVGAEKVLGAFLCWFLLCTCVHWYVVVLQRNQKEELIPLDGKKEEKFICGASSHTHSLLARSVSQWASSSSHPSCIIQPTW